MGLMKEPSSIQDDDAEVSSSVEDDLLSEHGQDDLKPRHAEQYLKLLSDRDHDNLEAMPLSEYLDLQFRRYTRRYPQPLLMAVCILAFMLCTVVGLSILRRSTKDSLNLRSPQSNSLPPAHQTESMIPHKYPPVHKRPDVTPAPAQPEPSECNYKKHAFCSARSLFHSTEIHRVVTDNIMRSNRRFLTQADYELVQEFAWMGFKKINDELEARSPEVVNEFERIQLKAGQKNAVLDLLSLLSDPSVQSVGFDVATIIRESKFATKKYLKFYIEDKLKPMDEIQKLAYDLIPKSVLTLWLKGGHDWEMTFDPRNIRSMREDHIKQHPNTTGVDFETKSLSIYAAVLQEGRVLLDIMNFHIRTKGPSWSTTLHDTIELLFESIALPAGENKHDFMESFLWPTRCGTQGLDALRASVRQDYGHEFKH